MTEVARSVVLVYEGAVSTVNARARMHWAEKGRENKTLREWAGWQALRLGPMSPMRLVFQQTTATRRKVDPDACQGASKPIIDGLVDAGVMPDDNGDHLHSITYLPPLFTGVDSLRVVISRSVDS